MSESERVRCRKCRKILLSKEEFCLRDAHGQEYHDTVGKDSSESEPVCASVAEHNCLYLSEESFPEFILNAIDESSWTKGKLHCPGCEARLGSFNFVSGNQCQCGVAVVPQVHILRSKVDWVKTSEVLPRAVSYPNNSVSLSPPTLPLLISQDGISSTPTEDTSSSSHPCSNTETLQTSQPTSDSGTSHSDNDQSCSPNRKGKCIRQRSEKHRQQRKQMYSNDDDEEVRVSPGSTNDRETTDSSHHVSSATTDTNPRGVRSCLFELLQDEITTSGEEESDYDEVIPESLVCAVCLDLLYSPLVVRPCSHTFCEPCLRRLARPDPTDTHCPLCRTVIGHCMPAPDLGSEAREKFPEVYSRRRQFELQHNSQHLPLPWLRNFRLRGIYEDGHNWVERAGGWRTMAMMMSLNILGIGLLLYLGRPLKMEQDPYLYPASTFSLHHS